MKKMQLGFTMIELLVVATIIVLLSTIGLVSYQNVSRSARNGKRSADIESVRSALVLYRADNSTYPSVTGKSNANFVSMIGTIQTAGYLSSEEVADPKDPTFQYTYSSNGSTFQVCATMEPAPGTEKCVSNP